MRGEPDDDEEVHRDGVRATDEDLDAVHARWKECVNPVDDAGGRRPTRQDNLTSLEGNRRTQVPGGRTVESSDDGGVVEPGGEGGRDIERSENAVAGLRRQREKESGCGGVVGSPWRCH